MVRINTVCATAFLFVLHPAHAENSPPTPKCDSAVVKEKAIIIANNNLTMIARKYGLPASRVDRLAQPKEVHFDPETGVRACVADYPNGMKNAIGYFVEWNDSANGIYQVLFSDPEAILRRYGSTALSKEDARPRPKPTSIADAALPNYSKVLGKYKVSFDCKKASNFAERVVCSNATISQLDGLLGATFRSRLSPEFGTDKNIMKQQQRDWLLARNECKDAACIELSYRTQISDLCSIPVVSGVHWDSDCDYIDVE